MAIFKFYQVYRALKSELGEEMTNEIFPEYSKLPDKMSPEEQVDLGRVVMNRMDEKLDKKTITKVRHKHTCNPSKEQIKTINELKEKYSDMDQFLEEYSKTLAPGFIKRDGDVITVSFGFNKCVCSMFKKLDKYEPISETWCECCNGHVIKIYNLVFEQNVESQIIEAIATGGQDCVFKLKVKYK